MSSLGERWESMAATIGLQFLNLWNAKGRVFTVLLVIVLALAAWFALDPSRLTFTLMMIAVAVTAILFITGSLVIPRVAEDITKATKYISRATVGIVIVSILLIGMLVVALPVLFPTPMPDEINSKAIEMKMDKVTMGDYVIEGPVMFRGEETTYIKAADVVVWGLTQTIGDTKIYSDYAELGDLEVYCTFVQGTGAAMGISSTSSWAGDERPPLILMALGDPVEMTEVTMHAMNQVGATTDFDTMAVASDPAAWEGDPAAVTDDVVDKPAVIVAESMEMSIDIPISSLLGALTGTMEIGATDVVLSDAVIRVPMATGEGEGMVDIGFDEGTIAMTTMRISTIESLSLIITDPLEMLGGILGARVELTNVELEADWMNAEGVEIEGLNMRSSDSTAAYSDNIFMISMDALKAESQNIVGMGYSELEQRPYMIMEVTGLDVMGMKLLAQGSDRELEIAADEQGLGTATIWAFEIVADNATLGAQEITEAPRTMNIDGIELYGASMVASYFAGTDVVMAGMVEDVITG